MKTKQFDCVEMMHRGAKRIYETTKNMSRQAELDYWKAVARKLMPEVQEQATPVGVVRESHAAYRISR